MADASSRPPGSPILLNLGSLPADPSPEFLKEVLRGNVLFVEPAGRPRVPPNIGEYLSWKEAFGQQLPARLFISAFEACSWRAVLLRASLLGAVLANRAGDDGGPLAERLIREPLQKYERSQNPLWARIAEYVAENRSLRIAHEQVIYLLAAMAILYGRDEGPEPSPEHFAVMFLGANDYLSKWSEPDSRQLTEEEKVTAELIHVGRFNTYPDALRDLVRVNLLYSRAPLQGPLSNATVWSEVQTRAFGNNFDDFFSTFILPLQFETQRWGTEHSQTFVAPVIEPMRWYANTTLNPAVGKAFFDTLTTTREAAQAELRARAVDGVPHAPTLFVRKPFVRIDDERVVAASPWAWASACSKATPLSSLITKLAHFHPGECDNNIYAQFFFSPLWEEHGKVLWVFDSARQ